VATGHEGLKVNEQDHIVTWLLGVLLIASLVAITVYGHVIIGMAYKASTPIVKVMED